MQEKPHPQVFVPSDERRGEVVIVATWLIGAFVLFTPREPPRRAGNE